MDYTKYINKRAQELKPSGIRKFFDIAGKMQDVIALGVGEPDFVTAWEIRNAAVLSLQKGRTQYTANLGLIELREEISQYLSSRYNIKYSKENEIIVTVGASEGIDLAMRALLEAGDEVLIPEPSYVAYQPCVTLSNGVAVPVPCTFENKFKVKPEDIEKVITKRTKAIILPYPNNPSGAILEKAELEGIAEVIKKYDLICVSDEVYAELTYGLEHVSIASLKDMWERTIVINGFSKAFAMTGWRVGYVCAPKELINPMYKIHQYGIMCAPSMSQYAALKALQMGVETDYAVIKDMRDQYDLRRRYLYKFFMQIGMDVFEPQGAFYIFPSTKSLNMTGDEFAERLLETERVAVVPGSAFGESGRYNVRVSYAYSMKSLEKATERIAKFINGVKNGKNSAY